MDRRQFLATTGVVVTGALAGCNQEDEQVTERWAVETGDSVTPPTVAGDTVYVGGSEDTVYALDAADGTERWSLDPVPNEQLGSPPAMAGGTVYVGSRGGTVFALDASDGTDQWLYNGNEISSWARPPALHDGSVYLGTRDGVASLEATDGTERWTFEKEEDVQMTPTIADGTIYVGTTDGYVYALSEP